MLELFSGIGSVGSVFRAHGWEVISLDNDPACEPTICAYIRTLDFRMLGGNFHFVWASPMCCHYSIARRKAKTPRDLEGADQLVARALDVIDHFKLINSLLLQIELLQIVACSLPIVHFQTKNAYCRTYHT